MSDKINEQTEKMREMAQTTLDKAKEAVSKYMAESQKLREKADSSMRATYSTAKEMNEKVVAFAEANVRARVTVAGQQAGEMICHLAEPRGVPCERGRQFQAEPFFQCIDQHDGPDRIHPEIAEAIRGRAGPLLG